MPDGTEIAGAGERDGALAPRAAARRAARRAVGRRSDRAHFPWNFGLALAEEGADALLGVLRAERRREALLLGRDALVEVGPCASTVLICSTASGAWPASLRAQASAVSNSSWSGTTWFARPDPVRLVGGDRVADQVHLERLGLAHQPRQPLRAAEAGDDPEVDLGLAEGGRLGRDAEVARHRQLAAAAERDRVDRRDRDRATTAPSPRMKRVRRTRAARAPSARASIFVNSLMSAPAREGEDVRGGDHQRAQLARRPRSQSSLSSRITCGRERVRGRPVEPDDRDVAARLEQHRLPLVARRRAAGRGRSPGRSSCRAGPGPPGGAGSSGGAKPSPHSRLGALERARASRRGPASSARANGPGRMPAPIIIPISMSLAEATPSSSTRQASTSAFSAKRSTMRVRAPLLSLPCS